MTAAPWILLAVGVVLTAVGAYRLGVADGRAAALRELVDETRTRSECLSALARLNERNRP